MQGRSVPGGFPSAPQPLCSSALWGAVLPFPLSPVRERDTGSALSFKMSS